jgi:hypothetical protein
MEQTCKVHSASSNGDFAADCLYPLLFRNKQLAGVSCDGAIAAVCNRNGIPRLVLPVLQELKQDPAWPQEVAHYQQNHRRA